MCTGPWVAHVSMSACMAKREKEKKERSANKRRRVHGMLDARVIASLTEIQKEKKDLLLYNSMKTKTQRKKEKREGNRWCATEKHQKRMATASKGAKQAIQSCAKKKRTEEKKKQNKKDSGTGVG